MLWLLRSKSSFRKTKTQMSFFLFTASFHLPNGSKAFFIFILNKSPKATTLRLSTVNDKVTVRTIVKVCSQSYQQERR